MHISAKCILYIYYANTERYHQPFILFFAYLTKETMFANGKVFPQIIKYQDNNYF